MNSITSLLVRAAQTAAAGALTLQRHVVDMQPTRVQAHALEIAPVRAPNRKERRRSAALQRNART